MRILTELIETKIKKLREALPYFKTISADIPPYLQRSIVCPALYLEMTECEPISTPGDGFLIVQARFEARCIVDRNTEHSFLKVKEFAADVMHTLYKINRPLPYQGHLQLLRAGEDHFKPSLEGYFMWLIEWQMEIHLKPDLEPSQATNLLVKPPEIRESASYAV